MSPIKSQINCYKAKEPSVSAIPWQSEEAVIVVEEHVDNDFNTSNINSIRIRK